MNWEDIWKIVIATLASVGGAGGLVVLAVKFASNILAERLSQKYQITLQKEVERLKSQLENKTYISKVRFDREFSIYEELSDKHITVVYDMGTAVMITRGAMPEYVDDTQEFVHCAARNLDAAEMTNKRYAPFISKNIFESYKELGKQAYSIISLLDLWDKFDKSLSPIIQFNGEPYTKAQTKDEIERKQKVLSKLSDDILDKLREYLSSLDTMEEK